MTVTLWYFMLKCYCFIPTTSEWSDERALQAAIDRAEKGDVSDPINIDSLNLLAATWLWDDQ